MPEPKKHFTPEFRDEADGLTSLKGYNFPPVTPEESSAAKSSERWAHLSQGHPPIVTRS